MSVERYIGTLEEMWLEEEEDDKRNQQAMNTNNPNQIIPSGLEDIGEHTTIVYLERHNKPKNNAQRALDSLIHNCLGPSWETKEQAIARVTAYLQTAVAECQPEFQPGPRKMKTYFPHKIKTFDYPNFYSIVIGDKSQPYFREVKIKDVSPKANPVAQSPDVSAMP